MNKNQRKAQRAKRSSILKKSPSRTALEDLDTNVDQTEFTLQFENTTHRRFSKRVSFADTNQIKEIHRVADIAKDWHDSSASDCSVSKLNDVSNLTTPAIKKQQQITDPKNAGPKDLQSLLKGTIVEQQEFPSVFNETVGSCAMDLTDVNITSEQKDLLTEKDGDSQPSIKSIPQLPNTFSFFDNSKLDFRDIIPSSQESNPPIANDTNNGNDEKQEIYTRDFLRSIKLIDANTIDLDTPRYPLVNPPTYRQCIDGVGEKTMQQSISVENTTKGTEGNTKQISQTDSTEVHEKTIIFDTTISGDMDLTCTKGNATASNLENLNGAGEKLCGIDTEDMNANNKKVDSNEMTFPDSDGMDFTCVNPFPTVSGGNKVGQEQDKLHQDSDKISKNEKQELYTRDFLRSIKLIDVPEELEKPTKSSEPNVSSCEADIEMDFTECVQRNKPKHLSEEDTINEDVIGHKKTVMFDNSISGDMDLTCTKGPCMDSDLTNDRHGHIPKDITTDTSVNTNKVDSDQMSLFVGDGMDFTCVVPLASVSDIANGHQKQDTMQTIHPKTDETEMEFTCVTEHTNHPEDFIPVFENEKIVANNIDKSNCFPSIEEMASTTAMQSADMKDDNTVFVYEQPVSTPGNEFHVPDSQPVVCGDERAICTNPVVNETLSPDDVNMEMTLGDMGVTDATPLNSGNDIKENEAQINSCAVDEMMSAQDNQRNSDTKSDSDDLDADTWVTSAFSKKMSKTRNSIGVYKARQERAKMMDSSGQDDVDTENIDVTKTELCPMVEDSFIAKEDNVENIQEADDVVIPETQNYVPERLLSNAVDNEQAVKRKPVDSTQDTALGVIETFDEIEIPAKITKMSADKYQEIQVVENPECHVLLQPESEDLNSLKHIRVGLEKSLIDDANSQVLQKKDQKITTEEFLQEYAHVFTKNWKQNPRQSIGLCSLATKPPNGLKESFRAVKWTPKEVSLKKCFVDTIKQKIEWLEKDISNVEEELSNNNPDIFKTIRIEGDESDQLVERLQQLAGCCKTVGKAYWKRDASKLHKGLHQAMKQYMEEELLPVTKKFGSPQDILDTTMKEIEEANANLDKLIKEYEKREEPPTESQAKVYEKDSATLKDLETKYDDLMKQKRLAEIERDEMQEKRKTLFDKVLNGDDAILEEKMRHKKLSDSLVLWKMYSQWTLSIESDKNLDFSFLSDTIILRVQSEEIITKYDPDIKIHSYSFEMNTNPENVVPAEKSMYEMLHNLFKRHINVKNLKKKYPDLSSLKSLLWKMSVLSIAARELMSDMDWISCQFAHCFCTVSSENNCCNVEFLPPVPGVDIFQVEFYFAPLDAEGACTDVIINSILKYGFLATSHQFIAGRRQLEHIGKKEVTEVLSKLNKGRNYLRRAVEALMEKVDYKT